MRQTARVFRTGRSQAVRIPASFRFTGEEVYIRRDPASGDVILSPIPTGWAPFLAAVDAAQGATDAFMTDRQDDAPERDSVL